MDEVTSAAWDLADVEAQMAESEADLAAGRTVPLRTVLDQIGDCIARMEAHRISRDRLTTEA